MGNIVLVNQVIGSNSLPLTKKFNIEDLVFGEICQSVFRSGGVDENIPLEQIFDDFEKQVNENFQENWKRNLIKELNELHTAGLSTPDYFTQDLKETRFEKYFKVVAKGTEEGEAYYREQYMKFFVLYGYIKPFYNEETTSKDNFYKNLAEKLEGTEDDGISVYGFETGLSLTFTLLDELSDVAPEIHEKALKNIYSTITQLKSGLLQADDYKFYSREEILNRYRDYLLILAESEKVNQSVKELAIRLIIVIGNLRESGEDYLVAYNLISANSLKINLDTELSLNKYFKESLTNTNENAEESFKISTKGSQEIEIMTGMKMEVNKDNFNKLAFDKKHIYIFNKHIGIFKVGLVESLTTAKGYIHYTNDSENSTDASLAYAKGQLFYRHGESHPDGPLKVLDKETLASIENEEFKAKVIKTKRNIDSDDWNKQIIEFTEPSILREALDKKEHEFYRSMEFSPVFSDGEQLYLVSTYIKGEFQENEDKISHFEIETYDSDTFAFISSVKLELEPEESENISKEQEALISEDTERIKQEISDHNILNSVFCTNGETLAIATKGKMYFFNLKTGIRSKDVVEIPNVQGGGYDTETNTFWFWKEDSSEPVLKSFKVDGFKSKAELGEEVLTNISQFIKNRTRMTIEQQKVKRKVQTRSLEKFLKHLSSKSSQGTVQTDSPDNESEHLSLFLILYTLSKGCENMDTIISELDSLYPDLVKERLVCQTKLFRSQYGVTVSDIFVRELVKCLETYSSFLGEEMNDQNILQQYEFLWILEIVNKFVLSLDRLSIEISEVIIEDHEVRNRLTELVVQLTSGLAEKGLEKVTINSEEHKDEITAIWNSILSECRGIQNMLVNLTSTSDDEISQKIRKAAEDLANKEITPSLVMFVNFLSTSDSIKNVLEEPALQSIFEVCCDIMSDKLESEINGLTLQDSYEEININELEEASFKFVRSFIRKSLIAIFKIYPKIAEALEKDQKKKLAKYNEQVNQNMRFFTIIYNKLVTNCQKIFKSATSSVTTILEEAVELHKMENTDPEKPSDKAHKRYVGYQKQLFEICYVANKFMDYIHICICTLASEKEHKMTRYLNNLCRKSIDLLHDLGSFCIADAKVDSTDLKVDTNICALRNHLSNHFVEFVIWSLSKIAHSFIKIKEVPLQDEEKEANQYLLKAKILSGGIQNRFLSTFSKETCHTIENLATITGDDKLVKYLSGVEKDEEDEIMEAIIHEGKDSEVDRLIDLLQWNLLRRNPTARVGGKEGMAVSRCAFAANMVLNHNDETCNYTNFIMMVDQLAMFASECDENMPENQRNKECIEELKTMGDIEGIFDRWKMASKMRIWLQEKRKDISNSIKKKADIEFRRKQEEERMLEENKAKTAEDIEKDTKEEHDEEEEKIDTNTNASKKSKIQPMSDDDLMKREKEQVILLVKKVQDKAELLIKLSTPAAWEQSDSSKKNLRYVDAYDIKGDEVEDESLANKLQKIRSIQASSGTITNYENLSNKEVFNSCSSSVLATLQCTVSAKSIMKAIENKYINAMNRYCGLKIMGELAPCYMADKTKISTFNWFCSALRNNTNILAHYSDDLTGMGDYLLDKCRVSFYEVYNGIVKQMKTTTDLNTIEFLLNCIKWRIGATDHQYILKSGIIQVLKDGNGLEDREKNPIKYSWGHLINYSTDSGVETLSHMVLETLEFIMMACFSRILGEGEDHDLEISKAGSSVNKIQQAHSVVNTNITEVLLASSFEIIFKQLNRYTQLISNMDPIDHQLFVEKRNEMRKDGQQVESDSTSPIEDEKTEEEHKKEHEEEEKEAEERAKAEEDDQEGFDRVADILTRKKNKEMKKLNSLYDDKVVLKLLRLLEVFTAISLKNDQIHQFIIQVTKPAQILELTKLLLNCRPAQGMITLKIFSNLIRIGIESKNLDDAFNDLSSSPLGKELLELETKTKFEDCSFLKFFFNLLLSIRASQWNKRRLESYGAYNISSGIVRLFRTILRSQVQPTWKKMLEKSLDSFISDIDAYSIEEFDVLISLFEGGEYNGMNIGAYGKTQDGYKFTTVGFTKDWYDLSPPDGGSSGDNEFKIREINSELSSKDEYLLAIFYDDQHPERNDMFLAVPDEVTLTSSLHHNLNDYLLDKERLSNFLKVMEIDKLPDKSDPISLTKRCVGMKILVEHIEVYGDKIANLLEESFRDRFINFLLNECSKPADSDNNLKCDWYDQKLYAIKKLATESHNGLMVKNYTYLLFNNKMMSLTTNIEGKNETFSKCFKLKAAMNYGCVSQKQQFKLIDPDSLANTKFRNDNIVIVKPSEIDTADKITEIFKHVDVIVTSDLDLKEIHNKLKEAKDDNVTYFKSIVLLDDNEFDSLQEILRDGPKLNLPDTQDKSEHESLLIELEQLCGFSKENLETIFKEKEDESLIKKVGLLVEACNEKKEEEKKEEKEENKDDNADEEVDHLLRSLEESKSLGASLSELTEFANNNYSSQTENKFKKGDLFSKAYDLNANDIIGTYKSTLSAFYKQLCKKTISSFFEQLSLEKLLNIILTNPENSTMFLKYLKIRGNEAVKFKITSNNKVQYEEFLKMLKKILEISSQNEAFKPILKIILDDVVIKGTTKLIKKSIDEKTKEIKKAFSKETVAAESLNIYLIPEVLKHLTQLVPELIFEKERYLQILSMLLLIPIVFRTDKDFHKTIYMSVYKLILPYVQEHEKFNDLEVVNSILNQKFLKKIFDKLPTNIDYSCNNLTNEQKVLFEIFLLMRLLEEHHPGASSSFNYPDCVLDLEKSKQILKEMKNFDLISYLVYYKNELTEEERCPKITLKTTDKRYNHKFTSKHEYSGFKKMKVEINSESKLDGDKSILFSKDREGKMPIHSLTAADLDSNDKRTFNINDKSFYMHYPYNPHRIKCFGYGYDYRLGNNESYSTTSNPITMPRMNMKVKMLRQSNGYTLALTEDNVLYRCGYNGGWHQAYVYHMEEYTDFLPDEKIIDVRAGYYNDGILTESGKLYLHGGSSNKQLNVDCTEWKNFKHKPRPNEEEEKVLNFDIGYNFIVYTTDNGKCYASGNQFLQGFNSENNDKNVEYKEIEFPEGVVPIKPFASKYDTNPKICLMLVKNNDKNEIWSCGYNISGVLGQGENKNESNGFAAMEYDKEINFVDCSIYYNWAMALTDKGELYSWGDNSSNKLCFSDSNTRYVPTEIPFFKDYVVHDFKAGKDMGLINASPKDDPSKTMFFVTGYVRGVNTSNKTSEGIVHLKEFDNLQYAWMESTEEVAYIHIDGEDLPSDNVSVHTGYECAITKQNPITGTMHFWKQGDEWIYLSEEGYKQIETDDRVIMPDICYATKNLIVDIPSKEWPALDFDELLNPEVPEDFKPFYSAHNIHGEEKINPTPKSTEEDIFGPEDYDFNPYIFYRLAKPLKDGATPPSLKLSDYFKASEEAGFTIDVCPDYTYEKSKDLIKLHKEKYNKTVNSIKKFDEKLDGELLEAIESNLTKSAVDFFNNPTVEVNHSDCEFTSKELKAKSAKEVQARLNAFLSFNENFSKVIPFVILDEELINEVTDGKTQVKADTLSVLFMVSKSLAFRCTKNSYIKKIADSLPVNYDEPEITYNRRLIQHKKDRGRVDNKGEWTIFGTTMKKVKEKNYEYLRVQNSSYKAWKSVFSGEGSIDAGGPYRETLSNMTDELYSNSLPLLIPTQNNKNDHGLGRDLWTINPSTTTPSHLEMYKFLGALIGMAFRAGHVMDLKFPSMFWKKLIGEPATMDDLHNSDAYAVQAIKDVENIKSKMSKEDFEAAMEMTWTTQLSNGESIPLCENGADRPVLYEEIDEYHEKVIKARSEEGQKQMEAIKEGFEIIFPMSILTILNWRDVEERVRGPSEISADALKSITEYSNCSSDNEFVKRFWKVFEEFTNEEKSMFLKFVWGRARLPPAERLKEQYFKLVLFDSSRFDDHDSHFPEAHTCFFQFDLPRYSNDATCKSRILYAIQACGEIDTDNSSYSIADDGGNYSDSD